MKDYPYLNRSLRSIKGERWKDIPGMEGYFKISNFGRIKKLPYKAVNKNGFTYTGQEMIMKPSLEPHFNNFKKDYTYALRGRLVAEGVYFSFTISRMVYHCFVDPKFDIKDFTKPIFFKDEDNSNIKPSNLRVATLSEKQKRIKVLKRSPGPMHGLTSKQRHLRQMKVGKKISKQVTQYDLYGKKIKTFYGAAEASRQTNIDPCYIGLVARGKRISAGGYLWSRGDADTIDVRPILKMSNLSNSQTGQRLLEIYAKPKELAKEQPVPALSEVFALKSI